LRRNDEDRRGSPWSGPARMDYRALKARACEQCDALKTRIPLIQDEASIVRRPV
jgi:hypothetical protein